MALRAFYMLRPRVKEGEAGYEATVPVTVSDRPSDEERNRRQRFHGSFAVLSDASSENLLVSLLQSLSL